MRHHQIVEDPFLREILAVLDKHLAELEALEKLEQEEGQRTGWYTDAGLSSFDFATGLGFVACQKFIEETCLDLDVEKADALEIGDRHWSGYTFAAVINNGANYWKHSSWLTEHGPDSVLEEQRPREMTPSEEKDWAEFLKRHLARRQQGRSAWREQSQSATRRKKLPNPRERDRQRIREMFDKMGLRHSSPLGPVSIVGPAEFPMYCLFTKLVEPLPYRFKSVLGFLEKWREDVSRRRNEVRPEP